MKLARYIAGEVRIEDAPEPTLPAGGLVVRTEACGLCSGELVAWYMDRKADGHVLGHEVAGRVIASEDARFPVGSRVFPHHHAPCGSCGMCATGRPVHCETWRTTRLHPGGMAERFAVPAANLADTLRTDDLRPRDAALIEPVACVEKALRLAGPLRPDAKAAVIGLGAMGLIHALLLRARGINLVAFESNAARLAWASGLGIAAAPPPSRPAAEFDVVFVLPGSQAAADLAFAILAPQGIACLFAPMPPDGGLIVPPDAYFRDLRIVHAYSCGPEDTLLAKRALASGALRAEEIVEAFTDLAGLPEAYERMRRGEIVKAMVEFRCP